MSQQHKSSSVWFILSIMENIVNIYVVISVPSLSLCKKGGKQILDNACQISLLWTIVTMTPAYLAKSIVHHLDTPKVVMLL